LTPLAATSYSSRNVGVRSVDPEWEEAVVKKESQRDYEAPALVVLGPVRDLTRGTNGSVFDGTVGHHTPVTTSH
jgi:hypothetical protein